MAIPKAPKPVFMTDANIHVAEEIEPETKPEAPQSKTVTVKNISKRTIHLENGRIEPGAKGIATRAELSYLYNYIERVG